MALGLSGAGSESLALSLDGVNAAAEWINDKGGLTVNGEKYLVKPVAEDIKMSPDGTTAAANKLVFEDKVSYIIGPPIPPRDAHDSSPRRTQGKGRDPVRSRRRGGPE